MSFLTSLFKSKESSTEASAAQEETVVKQTTHEYSTIGKLWSVMHNTYIPDYKTHCKEGDTIVVKPCSATKFKEFTFQVSFDTESIKTQTGSTKIGLCKTANDVVHLLYNFFKDVCLNGQRRLLLEKQMFRSAAQNEKEKSKLITEIQTFEDNEELIDGIKEDRKTIEELRPKCDEVRSLFPKPKLVRKKREREDDIDDDELILTTVNVPTRPIAVKERN